MTGERWTDRKAAWYARAVDRSDYPAAVLAALSEPLDGCTSVADIGAGTGAVTIPLLERGMRVTALEPSPAMRKILGERLGKARGSSRAVVLEEPWEQADLEPHDLLLFVHVPGHLVNSPGFLPRVARIAPRVAIVSSAGSWDKFWYRELYPLIRGRAWEERGNCHDVLAVLKAAGIDPRVKRFLFTLDQPFVDFEEAVAFWRVRLDPGKKEGLLRDFLGRRLTREGDGWIAEFGARPAAVLWWETGSSSGGRDR